MSLVPYKGKFHVEHFKNTTSEAFAVGDMVSVLNSAAGDGYLTKTTSSSPQILGTIQEAITSADAKYSTTDFVPVLVGDADAIWKASTTTNGGITEVGQFIDASDHDDLDGGTAYTYGVAQVVRYFSTTSLGVKLAKKNGPAVTTA
jgi:hypothetical protein